jgi:hypothetical protein
MVFHELRLRVEDYLFGDVGRQIGDAIYSPNQ